MTELPGRNNDDDDDDDDNNNNNNNSSGFLWAKGLCKTREIQSITN